MPPKTNSVTNVYGEEPAPNNLLSSAEAGHTLEHLYGERHNNGKSPPSQINPAQLQPFVPPPPGEDLPPYVILPAPVEAPIPLQPVSQTTVIPVESLQDPMRIVPVVPGAAMNADIVNAKTIGEQFFKFLDEFPKGREFSLAQTKIEEAVMWAVKGITKVNYEV